MVSIANYNILLIGVVVVANIVLGVIIYFHNRKSITGLFFLLLVLVSSFWSVLNYFSYYISDRSLTLWTMRFVMFFAVYQAFLFFLLMYVFPAREVKFNKWIKYFILPIVVLTSFITLSPFMFSRVNFTEGGTPQPVILPGIIIFAGVAIPLVVSGVFIMLKKLKNADSKTKPQFRILLTGLILMFLAIITFNFVFTIVFNLTNFIPLGALFLFPFIFATFYSIYKHELLNARIVGTEILVLTIIVLTFVEIVLSKSLIEIVFRGSVLIALLVIGVLFIKATIREVEQREKLQELTDKLKTMDKQKDEFISMAAHEMRAPMTAIKGYVSMVLEGDTGDIPEKARGFLADANNINDRLIRLVNNMLNVGRIEEGRMVYQIEEENLSGPVRMVFNQFTPEVERKGLDYKLEIPNLIKDKVRVDPDRIQEVIGNFLSNAVKYTDSGSIKVRLSQHGENFVRCEVIDTGPGISKDEQAKLFQKFHRVESNVGKTTGTGLGLYICKLLVEKFGGKIGLKSEPGKGSTFWFELPLVS